MNYPSFKEYLKLKESKAFLTFLWFNPPNYLHEQFLNEMNRLSKGGRSFVFGSTKHDDNKNPIPYNDKIKLLRKTFPKSARSIVNSPKVNSLTDAFKYVHKKDINELTVIVNENDVNRTERILNTLNLFESFNVIGLDINPDTISAEMRSSARENNFSKFSQKLPKTMNTVLAKESFELTKNNLLLKEHRTIVDLPVNSKREEYLSGNLFEVGDEVLVSNTNEAGFVTMCGTNYVLLETNDGKKKRKWITDIEPIGKKKNEFNPGSRFKR